MGNIAKRVARVEERLGLDQGPMTINVVWFGGEPVPPEQRRDNIVIRHVAYERIQERREGEANHAD